MSLAIGASPVGGTSLHAQRRLADDGQGDIVHRLRDGIERVLITDINNPGASAKAQSDVWVYNDRVSTTPSEMVHVPGGANVLYMDGHVKFVRYPEKAPVNHGVALLFGRLP